MVVEAHGGHFWSTQGSVQRPLDVTSLRIDAAERMGLQLADALISPTHYMTAFLRERAWRLPKTSLVIPNVLPSMDAEQGSLEVSSNLHASPEIVFISVMHYVTAFLRGCALRIVSNILGLSTMTCMHWTPGSRDLRSLDWACILSL